jgi:predicted nucleic acid-binding protein
MRADYPVLLDACVLANFGVCDLLLRLAERPRLFVPYWSESILAEVRRTQVDKLNWKPELADYFQQQVRLSFPAAIVSGFEPLVPILTNEIKDRHVLAAAIHGKCPLILTFNLRDFPEASLKPHSVSVSHPGDYLEVLYGMAPEQVMATLGAIATKRGMEVEDVLIQLGKTLPGFSRRLLDRLNA